MNPVIIVCFSLLIATIVIALGRLLSGPTILDRIISFDLIAISTVGLIAMLSIWFDTHLYIEIMLIFSLLGFFGTVAFICYLRLDPAKIRWRGGFKKISRKKKT